MMQWEQDLVSDIRTHSGFDYLDFHDGRIKTPPGWVWPPQEVMDDNRAALLDRFSRIQNQCPAILEVGVSREENNSVTTTDIFLKNKKESTFYVGLDIDDKTYLDDSSKNIFTIKSDSAMVDSNLKIFKSLGISQFGFIFIDGWHSIDYVLHEWEYTKLLAPNGIIGFHDTTQRPGPYYFIRVLRRDVWHVEENVCLSNHGIGFAWRR